MRKADVPAGPRRNPPAPMANRRRVRTLFVAGIADSAGMSLGWTFVLLAATARGGMAEAALHNSAMLAGVILSAPVTGWLAARLTGRRLLQLSGAAELVLRMVVLAGLTAGAAPWLIAVAIMVMTMAGWVSYAGMRAEVVAADSSSRSVARYAVCIVGVEAAGTAVAAVFADGSSGAVAGWLLVVVWLLYPGSLLPTLLSARHARAGIPQVSNEARSPGGGGRRAAGKVLVRGRWPVTRLMAAGAGVMVIAAGPTLMAVPLTEQLYGGRWVAGAAIAGSVGTVLAARAIAVMSRVWVPVVLRWLLWGLGMLAGWMLVPVFAPTVLVTQFVAGLSQAAFEGDMDARVAGDSRPGSLTRDLAFATSARALGAAISVRLLPVLVAPSEVGMFAGTAAFVLVILVGGWLVAMLLRRRSLAGHPVEQPLIASVLDAVAVERPIRG